MTCKVNADTTNGLKLTSDTSGEIDLQTNGTTKVHMDSSGNVGIGTSSPDNLLHIEGDQPTYKLTSTNALSTASGTETISDIDFEGQYNNLYRTTARIRARQDGTWSTVTANFAPTALDFFTQDNSTSDGTASPRMTIDSSGEVSIDSGYVTLNGNPIGGIRITVADDSVGTITPPRTGGFMCITQGANGVFPQSPDSAFLFYDVGTSLRIDKMISGIAGVSGELDVTTSDVTGTTGTDGRTTVAVQSNVIKIECRSSASHTYDITFL